MSKQSDLVGVTQGTLSVDGGTIKLDGNYPVGTANVALGNTALDSNVSGASNTAIGADALTANTASSNTAVGQAAMYSNTTGASNTAVGRETLYNNTTGQNNSALGFQALSSNTTGQYNIAVGSRALASNATASNNTAVGYYAGYSKNADIGSTFLGYSAGYNNTSGSYNTFVGADSGYMVTTGAKNTILGVYNGNQGGLDIRTSSNNIVLSDGDGNPRLHWNSSNTSKFEGTATTIWRTDTTAGAAGCKIAYNTFPNAHYEMTVGASGTAGTNAIIFSNGNGIVGTIATNGLSTAYNTSSDYRLKEDVQPMTGATSRLLSLKPVNFAWKADGSRVDGFLAHEVQAVVPEAIHGTKDEVDADGNPVYQGIDQSKLVPLLVATIKELEARIAALEAN